MLYEIEFYLKVVIKVLLADEAKVRIGVLPITIGLAFRLAHILALKSLASFDFLLKLCFVVVIKLNKIRLWYGGEVHGSDWG